MSRIRDRFKPLVCLSALFVMMITVGCGNDGSGGDSGGSASKLTEPGAGAGVGGAGRGPAPVDLRTAGVFAILAQLAISDVPASVVIGDVGLSPTNGAGIGIACSEVTGAIYATDAQGPAPCATADPDRLTAAVSDSLFAFDDAGGRAPDYTELAAGNIGGRKLGPATYRWSTAVQIPSKLTLTGGPNDVWIFQIAESLTVGAGVSIDLTGGALPQNVYWQTFAADLGAASKFKGVLLSEAGIVVKTGASVDGRLMSGTSISLDKNAVSQP